MARNLSFDGIGAVVATFHCEKEFNTGDVVAVVSDKTVGIPKQGEPFDGVVFDSEDTLSSVQLKGFVTVKTKGKIKTGRLKLVADGNGGVQEGSSPVRDTYLVVASSEDTVTFLL